jgi:hypothetical protein
VSPSFFVGKGTGMFALRMGLFPVDESLGLPLAGRVQVELLSSFLDQSKVSFFFFQKNSVLDSM